MPTTQIIHHRAHIAIELLSVFFANTPNF